MDSTKKEDFIRSINDKDYDEIFINTYKKVKQNYPFGATISRLIEILGSVFDIKEWDAFDYKEVQNINFESYLIECMQSYLKGEKTNFTELKNSILKFGIFTESERRIFEIGEIDKKLWAIFMAITNKNIL